MKTKDKGGGLLSGVTQHPVLGQRATAPGGNPFGGGVRTAMLGQGRACQERGQEFTSGWKRPPHRASPTEAEFCLFGPRLPKDSAWHVADSHWTARRGDEGTSNSPGHREKRLQRRQREETDGAGCPRGRARPSEALAVVPGSTDGQRRHSESCSLSLSFPGAEGGRGGRGAGWTSDTGTAAAPNTAVLQGSPGAWPGVRP